MSRDEFWPLTCGTVNHLCIASHENPRGDSQSSPAGELTEGWEPYCGEVVRRRRFKCRALRVGIRGPVCWREVSEGEGTGDACDVHGGGPTTALQITVRNLHLVPSEPQNGKFALSEGELWLLSR